MKAPAVLCEALYRTFDRRATQEALEALKIDKVTFYTITDSHEEETRHVRKTAPRPFTLSASLQHGSVDTGTEVEENVTGCDVGTGVAEASSTGHKEQSRGVAMTAKATDSLSTQDCMEIALCYSKVERLIDTLNKFAGDLDKHKFNANVSKAVGGATATVGSGLAIGGFIASFFNFGAAAVLIPVGIAVGVAGGGHVAGSAIAEIVFKKKKLQEAQKLWDSIFDDPVMQQYLKEIDDPDIGVGGFDIAACAARGIKAGLQIGGHVGLTAGKTALQAAKISVRALAVAGAAFEVVLLPLSLYDLINSSIEAHKKTKCSAGEELRKVAQTFETVRDKLQEQLDKPATNFNNKPLKSTMSCMKTSYLKLAQCYSKVERLIDTLNEFAEDLDKHKFNANVSKAVGGAARVVGSGLAIGGFITAFFTFGAAAILIPLGIAIGIAGGGTVAGTAIAEIVIKKTKLQEAQKLWKSILEDPVMQQYLKEIDDPEIGVGGFDIAACAARGIKAGLQIGGQVAQTAGKTALQAAKISVRALAVAGAVAEVVLLPLSLYDLINSSIEAHKKTKCPSGEVLRNVAQTFETVRDRLQEQLKK